MIYSNIGILYSAILIVLMIFLRRKNLRPAYILPRKYLKGVYTLSQIRYGIGIGVALLLPLDIGWVTHQEAVLHKPLPIQVIWDVSLSMSAYDVKPSRFSVAKEALMQMAQSLQGYPLSLISFSGVPLVTLPFTYDNEAYVQALQTISLGDFPPTKEFLGTAIGDALLLGLHNIYTLEQREKRTYQEGIPAGSILLITDGDANEGYDPQEVVPILQRHHIPVFVLGIGTQKYLMGYDRYNQPIVSAINTPLLQMIAKQTSGQYQNIQSAQDAKEFIKTLEKKIASYETWGVRKEYTYLTPYLLIALEIAAVGWLMTKGYFLFQYLKKKEKGV